MDTAAGRDLPFESIESPAPLHLPSYEEQHDRDYDDAKQTYVDDAITISNDARRIHWTLDSPSLETSFTVVDHGNLLDPRDDPEPYFLGQNEQGEPLWHRYSQSPYTTKPVSSIRVTNIDPLHIWDVNWETEHRGHWKPHTEGPRRPPIFSLKYSVSGPQECPCGSARPVDKRADVTVKGTGQPGGFVTVHDFLTTLHAYLWGRRADVLEAMGLDALRRGRKFDGEDQETNLIVTLWWEDHMVVATKEEWRQFNREIMLYRGQTSGAEVSVVTISGDSGPPRVPHPLPAMVDVLWWSRRDHLQTMRGVREEQRRFREQREAELSGLTTQEGEGPQ
ncbi:hypothetical protein B0T16DRAFT_386355 [Cercophora newfieldiana]|uniref:Uncharacterized protein n=1 Tax=Cercophora newfieldiana TaxID=92897 RepID=A0AA40D2J8_9PEZI|nr:hypothetical protein B0T16DRAFT_386355 [Cercophora newfieldiana]